jgi:hypothetical protein
MNPEEPKDKPVKPTHQVSASTASNPREVRAQRPAAGTQSVQTPDGGGRVKAPRR